MKKGKKNNSNNNMPMCDVWFLLKEKKVFNKRIIANKNLNNFYLNSYWG